MDKGQATEFVKKARENSKKRNFSQTFDLIFLPKDLDKAFKLDFFTDFTQTRGRTVKVCALVGPELQEQAKANCNTLVLHDDFSRYAKDAKLVKKLAKEHDYFIAQGNIMTDVAKTFGRVLGTRGKMPNPKSGCVVLPNANLKPLVAALQRRVRVATNKSQFVQMLFGTEAMEDETLADNLMTLFNAIISNLPQGTNNFKKAYIKLTMGKPVEVK